MSGVQTCALPISATVTRPGSVALPAKKLLDLCEQFVNTDVTIREMDGAVRITCGSFSSRLQSLPVDDFPLPPPVEGLSLVLPAAVRTLIAQTAYAISANTTKYVLDGALLDLTVDHEAAMAATDGQRLALSTMPYTGPVWSGVIPSRALGALAAFGGDEDVAFTVGERHLFFVVGERVLISRMLEGKFPAYRRMLPEGVDRTLRVDRSVFAAALRRVEVVADHDAGVSLTITPTHLSLSARSVDTGDAVEEMPVVYDGEPLTARLSGASLLDFLNAAKGTEITLAIKDGTTPFVCTDEGDRFLNVLMPRGE